MPDTRFHFLTSDRIFQSSDLKKDRALLDAARDGLARLRDTDGLGLVMLTESGLMELAEAQRREHFLAETGAELHRVRLLMRELGEDGKLSALTLGQWTWLEQFDADDLNEFLDEMATALVRRDEAAVADALMGWEETAAALADPERMAALTGDHDPHEYVEVPRPEGDAGVDAAQPVAAVPAAG